MEIRNRFIRSATTSYWSDKRGIVRPEIIDLYSTLAKGGIGLIIKGHLYVLDKGKAHIGMAGISHDYHIPKLKKLTSEVHKHDGKIVAQLNYGGINPYRNAGVFDRAGPSEYLGEGWKARALSKDEIKSIIDAFGDAAERAMAAGFDGIQIHGAHGYLISQFLSKLTNKRNDEWGGNLENRMRLLSEVYKEIRERVDYSTPVLLKMNCDDFSQNGFTIEESLKVAEVICKQGLDAIEISGGGVGKKQDLMIRGQSSDQDFAEASFAGHAQKIRKVTKSTPMALVDGIRSLECMKALVTKDVCDLISMSRPFIREPDLVKRLESGQKASICTSCGLCNTEDTVGNMMLRCNLD